MRPGVSVDSALRISHDHHERFDQLLDLLEAIDEIEHVISGDFWVLFL